MFRNVLGAQEAAVHRQSEVSLTHKTHPVKVVQDLQSENIAQAYPTLQKKWSNERKKLKENLKSLQKHKAFPTEIKRMKSLIVCLDDLLENGEVSKDCQALINGSNEHLQLFPETYFLAKKPLGDKLIRLPRHVSKTTPNRSHSLQGIPSDAQHSDDKLTCQIAHRANSVHKPIDQKSDEAAKTGIQFYVVAEPFCHQTDKKEEKT